MEKVNMVSRDITADNIEKIGALFPNCITEVKNGDKVEKAIDFDKLRQELSRNLIEGKKERYEFTWPDKRQAIVTANAPIAKTLRPVREKSVDFDNTQNVYIEGDNLDALKLLQETYLGKIKMIYIDPPYNTGNDFVYLDNFEINNEEYLISTEQQDTFGYKYVTNCETNGCFHSDWLNMIYPRIKLAKDLLSEDGFLFVSIDDNEVENMIKVCNEIFGEKNHCGTFVVNSTPNARDYGHIGKMHEFCVFYSKNYEKASSNMLPDTDKTFKYLDEKGGYNIHPLYNSNEAFHKGNRPNLYYPFYVNPCGGTKENFHEISLEKKIEWIEVYPPLSQKNKVPFVWRWGKEKAQANLNSEIVGYEVSPGEFRIVEKMRHDEKIIRSLLLDTCFSSRRGTAECEEIMNGKVFSFPKPLSLIKTFTSVASNSDSLVLDFFSGSATTAHAVMKLNAEDGGNRKFIMVQLPEICDEKSEAKKAGYNTICDIGEERIRRAGKKIKEEAGLMADNLDTGFRVFKIDDSNMKDVYYHPDEFQQDLLLSVEDNIKEDRTPEDLLFQVMIDDFGIPLSAKIEKLNINGKTVFNVEDGHLVACFDKGVTDEVITAMAKLEPNYAVLRDSSYDSDSVAVNFEQIFNKYSPDTVTKIL